MDSIPQFWLTADPEHLNERVSVLDTHRLTVCSAADLATVRIVLTAQVLGPRELLSRYRAYVQV